MIKPSERGEGGFSGDIAIELDDEGVIRAVRFGRELGDAATEEVGDLEGTTWVETVTSDTREKAERLLAEALSLGITGFRQIQQSLPGGSSVPVEYAAVHRPDGGGMILVGRDLRGVAELQRRYVEAQQSLERDYWKLRRVETRYRMIFRESIEPGVVVDPQTLRVLDANPAAMRALGLDDADTLSGIVGRSLLGEIGAAEREALRNHVLAVLEGSDSHPVRVSLGPDRIAALGRATVSYSGSEAAVFVRFALLEDTPHRPRSMPELTHVMEELPDGFVLLDERGEVLHGNRAFGDLVQLPRTSLPGRRIQDWLERPGADWTVIRTMLAEHGAVRAFPSTLVGAQGAEAEVEISGAPAGPADAAFAGLVLRHVGRRLNGREERARWLRRDRPAVSELVGKMTLSAVVEEIVSEIEQEFIGAALEMTSGNRTAAAELLGLSRQSLYSRLDRYDFDQKS